MAGVGLADEPIARLVVRRWRGSPEHQPVVAGVGDAQPSVREADCMRPAHAGGGRLAAAVLVALFEVGLPEHEVRRLAAALGQAVPHQHAPIAGVGNPQPRAVPRHAVGPEQGRSRRPVVPAVRFAAVEIGLAQHHVGRLMGPRRPPVPDQHPVVPGIGHRETGAADPAGGDAGGHVHRVDAGVAARVAAFAVEGRLAEQDVGRRVVGGRCAMPAQHAVVAGVRHPQRSVGCRTHAARAEHRGGRRHDRLREAEQFVGGAEDHPRAAFVEQGGAGNRCSRRTLGRRGQRHMHAGGVHVRPSGAAAPRPGRRRP